jgi:prepilin-type N-terminal cleavage/methylation domain-containing protein
VNPAPAQQGFSLVELTVVLIVIGALSLLANFAFSGADVTRSAQRQAASANAVREALRYFMLVNRRLPCPDFDGNGYEDCATAGERGFAPYLTLGLDDAPHDRMRYTVYRNGAPDDVTTLAERTGDTEGQPDYLGYGDTVATLAAIPVALDTGHLHVAAVDAGGASDCVLATHPAFVLIAPGADRDGDDNSLDGINANSSACVASPLQASSPDYDDFVAVESADALIGWLSEHHVH